MQECRVFELANRAEKVYIKTLSSRGNPRVETLGALLKAMGLNLAVEVANKKRIA